MRIISREEWGARPPRYVHQISTPTDELWLHHTAGALDENGNGVWWDDMRSIQDFHMDGRGWSDIAYSFLIAGGLVWEGRGAGIAGGHTKDHNTISHAICVVGNYEFMQPTQRDLEAIAWLMRHGRTKGWWGGLTGDHSAASGANTSCCGRNLRARIPDLRRMAVTPTIPSPQENDMALIIRGNDSGRPARLIAGSIAPLISADVRTKLEKQGVPSVVADDKTYDNMKEHIDKVIG